jgi:hypothetical protein
MKTIPSNFRRSMLFFGAAFAAFCICYQARGDVQYVDWTSFTPSSSSGAGDGSAVGTLTFGSQVVHVSYSGDVYSGGGLTTTVNNNAPYYSSSNYTPPISLTDNISNDGGANNVHTISFDVPVVNPHFHVASMGAPGTTVDWVFNFDFTVLSGTISRPAAMTLRGTEDNGTIGFIGTFTSISWTTPVFENTTGFQFSVDDVAPEPGTYVLLALGGAALFVRHRFFRANQGRKI